jgi:S-adenosylmethionine:diacylglycerol 3-amino-3-carboxypropyl transferase
MIIRTQSETASDVSLDHSQSCALPSINHEVACPENQFFHAGICQFVGRMILDRNLYGSLAFAETGESLRLNIQALQVGSGDRVVGVTSSGDLLLSLLAAGPGSVIGIDANRAQTVLAHLKATAIATLPVEEYLRFMGLMEADPRDRLATFSRISRDMPSFARRYMLTRQTLVAEGILNQGMTHRIIQVLKATLALVLSQQTLNVFLGTSGTDADRSEALDLLTHKWSIRYLIQPILRAAAPLLKWLFFPHRFCRISSRPDEIIGDFFTTFRPLLVQGIRKNPVLSRSALGHIHPEWWQHLYNDHAFQQIRNNLPRLSLTTADILSGMRRIGDGWATRVYLSNVADYLSEEELRMLVEEVQRAAAPGARVLYCSMYDKDLLSALGPQIPASELGALRESDNVFIYPLIMVRTRGPQ